MIKTRIYSLNKQIKYTNHHLRRKWLCLQNWHEYFLDFSDAEKAAICFIHRERFVMGFIVVLLRRDEASDQH